MLPLFEKIILLASALQSPNIKCFHCGAFSHHASVCEKSEERETQEATQVPNKNATSLYLDAKSEICCKLPVLKFLAHTLMVHLLQPGLYWILAARRVI